MKYKFAPAMIFKQLAFLYDPLVNITGVGVMLQKRILNIANIKNGAKILDVGCGTGTLAILFKQTFPDSKITGIDPDNSVLRIARSKAIRNELEVTFVQSGAEKIPFENKSFDMVTSSLAFHHLSTEVKKQALVEIHRVLNDNGTFLLVDIGKPVNILWKIILHVEALIEPKEYIKDNLQGNIPILMRDASFRVEEARSPYSGIYFWKGKKY